MSPRIPLPTDNVTSLGVPDTRGIAPAIGKIRSALARSVYASGPVEAVALELVRMRNARLQQCNL